MARFLITGGAGFIGSHTCLVLLNEGHSLLVLDNFSNSSPEPMRRVLELADRHDSEALTLVKGDVRSSMSAAATPLHKLFIRQMTEKAQQREVTWSTKAPKKRL